MHQISPTNHRVWAGLTCESGLVAPFCDFLWVWNSAELPLVTRGDYQEIPGGLHLERKPYWQKISIKSFHTQCQRLKKNKLLDQLFIERLIKTHLCTWVSVLYSIFFLVFCLFVSDP